MKSSFHPHAYEEMVASARYYEERETGLGMDFLDAVEAAVDSAGNFPHSGPQEFPQVRRRMVRGFPYHLIYETLEQEIRIVAVMHQRRRPGYWKERLE